MATQDNIDSIRSQTNVEYPRIRGVSQQEIDDTKMLIEKNRNDFINSESELASQLASESQSQSEVDLENKNNQSEDYNDFLSEATKSQDDWIEQYKKDMATGNY